ncbi:hypothetical protein MRX96_001870 [Rhipicephalus microplus]
MRNEQAEGTLLALIADASRRKLAGCRLYYPRQLQYSTERQVGAARNWCRAAYIVPHLLLLLELDQLGDAASVTMATTRTSQPDDSGFHVASC